MPSKRIFTEEEEKYIVDNWEKETIHSMKKKFNCSWYAVASVGEKHGLELPKSNEWTDEEISALKELSEKYHYKEIAKLMGKSENAIYLKAKRLDITLIQDRRKWTEEEEKVLMERWGEMSIEKLGKKLKRSVFSLKVKAVRLGLGPMIDNTEYLTISDVMDIMNVTRDRVSITWKNAGLKIDSKKLTNTMHIYIINFDDLIEFLKNNQDMWDSRIVEPYMLGPEDNWLLEKRKNDEINPPRFYKKWTDEEKAKAIMYIKKRKTYKEIASLLDKSECAVMNFLINEGYGYYVPCYWGSNEVRYLRENYKDKTYKEIGEHLGRTEKATAEKARQLGYSKK